MNPTVLLVDDSESGRGFMRRALEQSDLELEIAESDDGAQALTRVLGGQIDIVVTDVVMPHLDGIGLLRGIRKQHDPETLPVILVTTETGAEKREIGFEAGANDYLSRPFTALELVSRLKVQLRLRTLQNELRAANDRLRRVSTHDDLTGLNNRRHMFEACRRELARSRRHEFSMSLAVADVDRFRTVNDRVGTLVGDAILAEMAGLFGRELRAADILARFGGEKFAFLLPQTDAQQARQVCERLRDSVRAYGFPSHQPGDITIGVGLVSYPGGALESVDEMMNAAERSLEQAKSRGGDTVEEWSSDVESKP